MAAADPVARSTRSRAEVSIRIIAKSSGRSRRTSATFPAKTFQAQKEIAIEWNPNESAQREVDRLLLVATPYRRITSATSASSRSMLVRLIHIGYTSNTPP